MISDDRFILKELIAEGGQGAVWLADDTLYHRPVAVKLLRPDASADSAGLRRLLKQEAALQASLSPEHHPHRNIVYIVDVRVFAREIGIVMEFVDGGSLAKALGPRNSRKILPLERILEVATQVCEGLSAAHDRGIIHRDIKPGNVLLRGQDGVVKLTDWGIAKNIDIAGRGSTYLGTPPYMSPEVIELNDKNQQERIRGAGIDHRTDIYSLGVMLYEMLTGLLPFDGAGEIRRGTTERHFAGLSERNVESPLVGVVLKALSRHPWDRFQSAREMHQALAATGPALSAQLEQAWDLYRKGLDQQGAEKKFLEIVDRYSSDPRGIIECARFYIQCTREEDAIAILTKGIGTVPRHAALWNARGRLLAKRNPMEAIPDLEKALELGLAGTEARQVQAMLQRIKNSRAAMR